MLLSNLLIFICEMGVIMEPTCVMIIQLNKFNPFKAFITNVWNTGSAESLVVININNLKRVREEIL